MPRTPSSDLQLHCSSLAHVDVRGPARCWQAAVDSPLQGYHRGSILPKNALQKLAAKDAPYIVVFC